MTVNYIFGVDVFHHQLFAEKSQKEKTSLSAILSALDHLGKDPKAHEVSQDFIDAWKDIKSGINLKKQRQGFVGFVTRFFYCILGKNRKIRNIDFKILETSFLCAERKEKFLKNFVDAKTERGGLTAQEIEGISMFSRDEQKKYIQKRVSEQKINKEKYTNLYLEYVQAHESASKASTLLEVCKLKRHSDMEKAKKLASDADMTPAEFEAL